MTSFAKRPHLTFQDRVPRSYKDSQKILSDALSCKASLKSLLYGSKMRGNYLSKVSAMTVKVLSQKNLLEKIIRDVKLLEKEPFLAKELALILVHELIFRGTLPGESKPIVAVRKFEYDIQLAYKASQKSGNFFSNEILSVPKYTRVNTLLSSLTEVLEDLENSGYQQIHYEKNITDSEYYDLVKTLQKGTFLIDYHFDDILVFASDENLSSWSLVQNRHVVIQDKSSCIPARVLEPIPGSTVIDACAAPGMKSLHLAALMGNKGTLFACEKNEQRFQTLKKIVKNGNVRICKSICDDFCNLDPRDEKFCNVEYILLDPTCSGSGMVSRMDCVTDTKDSKNEDRINKLAGFQIKLLKHALLFPSVKRVVYSTCSTTEQENEFVVHEVLNHFSKRFHLVNIIPEWSHRGSENFAFGNLCLRAHPAKTLTNGFFVALFERIEYATMTDCRKSSKRKKRLHRNEGLLSSDIHNVHGQCIDKAEIPSIVNYTIEADSLHTNEGPELKIKKKDKSMCNLYSTDNPEIKKHKHKIEKLTQQAMAIDTETENIIQQNMDGVTDDASVRELPHSKHHNSELKVKKKKDRSMCNLYDDPELKVKKKKHKNRTEEYTQQTMTINTETENIQRNMDHMTDDDVSVRGHPHSSKHHKRKRIVEAINEVQESEENYNYAEESQAKKHKKKQKKLK